MATKGGIGGFLQGVSGEGGQDPSANAADKSYRMQQTAEDRSADLYGRADESRKAVQAKDPYQAQSRRQIQNTVDNQRGYMRDQQGSIEDQRGAIGEQRQNIQQEQQLGSYNQSMMAGKGPSVATGQLRQGIDQSIAAQIAAARSGSNPGGEAAAMRGAQSQAATMQGQAAAQASQIRAQESQAAAQRQQSLYGQIGSQQQSIGSQYANIGGQQAAMTGQEAAIAQQRLQQYGLQSQNANANAQLALQSRNADDQRMLGMYNAALGQEQVGGQVLHNQQQIDMTGYQAKNQADEAAVDQGTGFLGGVVGALGGALSAFSDEHLKEFSSDEDGKGMSGGPSAKFDGSSPVFGSKGPSAFQRGMAGGAKFGGQVGGALGKAFGGGPEVGTDAWAKKTLDEPAIGYSSPNVPDATQGPDWLHSYMSGKGGMAPPPAGGGGIVRENPYGPGEDFVSDEDLKGMSGGGVGGGVDLGGGITHDSLLKAGSGLSSGNGGGIKGMVGGGGITGGNVNLGKLGMVGGGGGGSYMSDEETKTPKVRRTGREAADDFMDAIHSYMYRYKDPRNEPRDEPTGGEYLGITAQDLERAPHVGRQIVVDTPAGKKVNTAAAVSAALGSIARLNERLKSVESGTPLRDPRGTKPNEPPAYDSSDQKSKMTPKKRRA